MLLRVTQHTLLLSLLFGHMYCQALASQEKSQYHQKTKQKHTQLKIAPTLTIQSPIEIKEWQSLPTLEINFGFKRNPQSVIYSNELETQARNRNLLLIADSPARGLLDNEAEVIHSYGLRFKLDSPWPASTYLYLDLVSYRVRENTEMTQINWLEVKVNGHQAALLYAGGNTFFASPVIVPLERNWLKARQNLIELIPAPHAPVFAIWDAFISRFLDKANTP